MVFGVTELWDSYTFSGLPASHSPSSETYDNPEITQSYIKILCSWTPVVILYKIIPTHDCKCKWESKVINCFYRLKLRILDLDKSTGHMLHAKPSMSQLLPLARSSHSAQGLHQGCLQVVIWQKQTALYICCVYVWSRVSSDGWYYA